MGILRKKNYLTLELDVSELSQAQQRLIRYINSALLHTVTTLDEAEYFEGSNEVMRMFASLIKQANFVQEGGRHNPNIPYPTQALEFCIETIADDISQNKTIIFDN